MIVRNLNPDVHLCDSCMAEKCVLREYLGNHIKECSDYNPLTEKEVENV